MQNISVKKSMFLNRDRIIILLFGLLLLAYYCANIGNIYTIWELDDEAGYIFNASLLSRDNWKEVFSNVTAYYGYGYSLILIPLFYLCRTGESLIRGAIAINIICVLLLYIVQIIVMSKVLPECKKSVLSGCSAVMCLLPYLVASSMKTICEVYLTLLVWVIALLLYKVMEKRSYIYGILFCFFTTYILFVHIRSVAVVGAAWMVLFLQTVYAKNRKKSMTVFFLGLIIVGAFYGIFNFGKTYILSILGSGILVQQNEATINLVDSTYILDRIKWLFTPENLSMYFHCFVGKLFYLIVSTGGTFLLGIFYVCKKIKEKKWMFLKENYIEVYFLAAFTFMMGLSVVSGTGETYEYFIYGRYYEYVISFFAYVGMYQLIERPFKKTMQYMILILIIVFTGIVTANLSEFTMQNSVILDTNRYAGFSYGISQSNDWKTMIFCMVIFSIAIILFSVLIRERKYRILLVPAIVMCWFLLNNKVVLDKINSTQNILRPDIELIDIVQEDSSVPVYFIYEPYKYDKYFTRLQVHLKDEIMNIILPEEIDEIPEDAYVITYIDGDVASDFKDDKKFRKIMKTVHYQLFSKISN